MWKPNSLIHSFTHSRICMHTHAQHSGSTVLPIAEKLLVIRTKGDPWIPAMLTQTPDPVPSARQNAVSVAASDFLFDADSVRVLLISLCTFTFSRLCFARGGQKVTRVRVAS